MRTIRDQRQKNWVPKKNFQTTWSHSEYFLAKCRHRIFAPCIDKYKSWEPRSYGTCNPGSSRLPIFGEACSSTYYRRKLYHWPGFLGQIFNLSKSEKCRGETILRKFLSEFWYQAPWGLGKVLTTFVALHAQIIQDNIKAFENQQFWRSLGTNTFDSKMGNKWSAKNHKVFCLKWYRVFFLSRRLD